MSYAKKCDRCGALYDQKTDGDAQVIFQPKGFNTQMAFHDSVPNDICPRCASEFKSWMNVERRVIQ